jgi:D-tyrosyl-tRNA(Tyr) deacylase
MKVAIQRVSSAAVHINGSVHIQIQQGLLIFLGIESSDTTTDADWLCQKIIGLRIFSDQDGLMNQSVIDIDGALLLVSQFTLIASYKKGNRPSFVKAARPEQAVPLYEYCIEKLSQLRGTSIATGVFGADMQVVIYNDGPVTILMDTQNKE